MTYTELSRYVSRVAAEWPDPDACRWRGVDGTLVFVDISGFTTLSERLTRFGRVGAEELTELLSRLFGGMLDLAYGRGGALLKFGGDALLLFFDGPDHAVQACSAAVEMRSSLRAASGMSTSVGKLTLRMSVGINSGPIDFFLVGGSHLELLVTGPVASGTTMMEKIAEAGEIVVSSATKALLPAGAAEKAKDSGWLLRWRRGVVQKRGVVARTERDRDGLARLVSVGLRDHLANAAEPEHRIATVAFIRYSGVDDVLARTGGEATADVLHDLVTLVQTAAEDEEVTFLDSDIDVDGGKILLFTGVPYAREDDVGRMLRTVRRVMDSNTTLALQIGVNRGHTYAGHVGTKYRSAFAAMGDTVNVGARLMAAAPAGSIYVSPAALERSSTLFEATALEPLRVKGKSAALRAYSIGPAIGSREERHGGLPYVGRDEEISHLTGALASALEGSGSVVCVRGRGGAGKSRLLQEALARVPSLPVVQVRAEAYGAATAYQALRAPFRALLAVDGVSPTNEDDLTRAVVRLDPELIGYLPLLADVTNIAVEPTPESDAIEPRFRQDVLAQVIERLLTLARPGPLALVIDDAHWLDQASAELLERLVTVTERQPWAVLVLRRDEATGFTPSIGQTFDLAPLPRSMAETLVHLATEAAPLRPDEVAAIVDRADGVPLVLEEIVRALRLAGAVDSLPDSVEEMIAIQIDELGALARRILRAAAVFGRRFPAAPFEEVLHAEGIERDAATTTELDDVLQRDGDDYITFRHALVQEVAYGGLSYRRRRELHGLAGDAIVRVNGDDPERAAGVLSLHFERAGRDEQAWRFARVAGDRAGAAFANAEAAIQYERALHAASRLPEVPATERARIWALLGDVREREGVFDGALDAYHRAAKELEGDAMSVAEMWLKRARARERAGRFVSALRDITRGLRMLGEADRDAEALRSRLLAFRSVVRQGEGRPVQALGEATIAAETARRAAEDSALAQAYSVIDWAHLALGEPDKATLGEETLRIYESLGDLEGQGKVMNTMGAIAYFADRWDEAVSWYERARAIGARTGNHVQAAISAMNIGEIEVYLGRFDEAEPLLRDAIRVFTATGFADGRALAQTYLGRMLLDRGDLTEADACLASAVAEFQALNVPGGALEAAVHLAACRVRQGDVTVLDDLLEPALAATGHEAGPLEPAIARVRAEAMAAQRQWSAARALIDDGLAAADRHGLPFERRLLLDQLERLEVIDLTDRTAATASSPDRLARTAPR